MERGGITTACSGRRSAPPLMLSVGISTAENRPMNELNVFVSVGGIATEQHGTFVRAVEDRPRSEGLVPHTVGRNTFSADAPLKTVTELLGVQWRVGQLPRWTPKGGN
jgi:hypothetical protein